MYISNSLTAVLEQLATARIRRSKTLQPSGPSGSHLGGLTSPHRSGKYASRGRKKRLLLVSVVLPLLLFPAFLVLYLLHNSGTEQPLPRYFPGPKPGISWMDFSAQRKSELELGASLQKRKEYYARKHNEYLDKAKNGPYPIQLKYPILWSGALFSKSGYGTEAISYVASLLQLGMVRPSDIWISQSGDYQHDDVINTMHPSLLAMLRKHHYKNMTARLPLALAQRPLVVVCHSFPDCWRTPSDDDTRLTFTKILKAIQNFLKYKVLRKKFRDHGCPCPHADIRDQVAYRVGRTMFETEHLPGPLAAYAAYTDEVWVPSDWGRQSFAESGIPLSKLHTLYQGINTTQFSPEVQPPADLNLLGGTLVAGRQQENDLTDQDSDGHMLPFRRRVTQQQRNFIDQIFNVTGETTRHPFQHWKVPGSSSTTSSSRSKQPFRFLSVFKWEARKGWDILLPAYVQEFMNEPNVELHIVTKQAFEKVAHFPTYFRRVVGPILNITGGIHSEQWDKLPRIILHYHHIGDADYPGVYASMDALVCPTRGEGWGRPQIEAMSMGKPVITTNWSGLTAFIDDKTAYPIHVRDIVPVQDTGPNSFEWFEGQRWAEPDAQHLRQLMRSVFTHRAEAAAKGAAARQKIARDFSELAVTQQLLAHVLRVQDVLDDILTGQLV